MSMREISNDVAELLNGDHGHGFDHVSKVRNLAVIFAQKEGADVETVELAALLHDVDDYKLFGEESAKNLTNANRLLDAYGIEEGKKKRVLDIIRTMGYNKYLDGVRPASLEGKIISDADMCEAIGAEGILRTHAYALSIGNSFYDPELPPEDATKDASAYRVVRKGHSVQHFFDKLLIIPTIMMTAAGREEAAKREKIMIDFLEELFRENNAAAWQEKLQAHQNKISPS